MFLGNTGRASKEAATGVVVHRTYGHTVKERITLGDVQEFNHVMSMLGVFFNTVTALQKPKPVRETKSSSVYYAKYACPCLHARNIKYDTASILVCSF